MAFWNRQKNTASPEPEEVFPVRRAVELITEYEKVLSVEFDKEPVPIAVDNMLLPADKERIRAAYMIAFMVVEDPKGLEMMRDCFLRLANFQPGVGMHPLMPIDPADHENYMRRFRRISLTNPAEAGRETARYRTFPDAVEQEQEQLIKELRRIGQWTD